jgi:uncharacterized membrane protein
MIDAAPGASFLSRAYGRKYSATRRTGLSSVDICREESAVSVLILGLLIFLGLHSIRIFADDRRKVLIARMGENGWKSAYSVLSIIGLALVVWGYGMARREPVILWSPPAWSPHLAALLTLAAFILFPAAYVPGNHFKAIFKHPMASCCGPWLICSRTGR